MLLLLLGFCSADLFGPVSRGLLGAILLPGALSSKAAAPSRPKLHGEGRSMYFSPEREALLAEGVPESLSPRRLFRSE